MALANTVGNSSVPLNGTSPLVILIKLNNKVADQNSFSCGVNA